MRVPVFTDRRNPARTAVRALIGTVAALTLAATSLFLSAAPAAAAEECAEGHNYSFLQSHPSGRYFTVDTRSTVTATVNGTVEGYFQAFYLCSRSDWVSGDKATWLAFKSAANGKYLTVDAADANKVKATSPSLDRSQAFRRIALPTGGIALQYVNSGLYLSAGQPDGTAQADTNFIGGYQAWNLFTRPVP